MEYFFYFNLALFIGSTLAILYGFYYLFFKKNEDITEGEFVINLILIIFLFFKILNTSLYVEGFILKSPSIFSFFLVNKDNFILLSLYIILILFIL